MLRLANVSKSFGPTRAVDDVSLELHAGEIAGLVGENGAGKTTLMRVAFGMLHPDAGEVRVDGTSRRFASPADAIAASWNSKPWPKARS